MLNLYRVSFQFSKPYFSSSCDVNIVSESSEAALEKLKTNLTKNTIINSINSIELVSRIDMP